jgi:hypothetical protein
VATTVAASTAFLYTGSNPVQQGVAAGTIDPVRAAVLGGRVLDRNGSPVSGVTVTVLDHPEFGSTLTDLQGNFSMAVNGGGLFTVNYARDGYIPVQRQAQTTWDDYTNLPDVVLIPRDSQVTAVDLTAATPVQVARGSVVTDGDGTRQATLFFAQGTQATMTLPDGTTQPLTTLHVRATEYTVGATGPEAMPGDLPPTSAYTYAVDYSVDEAVAAGATGVTFSRPVISYLENFLNFPVGTAVPEGFYDRGKGVWVPSDNGLVVKVLSVTGGEADLDGSGTAASPAALAALGVTDAERQTLAAQYKPGQSLWRVPISHFSSWDSNWGKGLPADATLPNQPTPQTDQGCSCSCSTLPGSIIDPQNQLLGESVDVAGTPFSLTYESSLVPGNKTGLELPIQLTGPTIPKSLVGIELHVVVAGQEFSKTFAALPNESYTFVWDGKDRFGRVLQGEQTAKIAIGYLYPAVYQSPASLGASFGYSGRGLLTGNVARTLITLWQFSQATIGRLEALPEGLGGWSLSVQDVYDPVSKVLYQGDGTRRDTGAIVSVSDTVESRTQPLTGFALAPDGTMYYSDGVNNRGTAHVIRRAPDGTTTSIPTGSSSDVRAVGPDGSLCVSDINLGQVFRVAPNGAITVVAGNGHTGPSAGDGGPATAATFSGPTVVWTRGSMWRSGPTAASTSRIGGRTESGAWARTASSPRSPATAPTPTPATAARPRRRASPGRRAFRSGLTAAFTSPKREGTGSTRGATFAGWRPTALSPRSPGRPTRVRTPSGVTAAPPPRRSCPTRRRPWSDRTATSTSPTRATTGSAR